jgi:regulation of enolase protein 1 (concanavalin A-like superfamily)
MSLPEPLTIAPLPMPLDWLVPAQDWQVGERSLELSAGPATDLFTDPAGGDALANAPGLVGVAHGDFLLSARVRVEFAATFDAGVLLVHRDERNWAKLCFELSPQGEPTVVSVVTRGVSDDCNSFALEGAAVWLRIARLGNCFAFHASSGDGFWKLVRYFALEGDGEPSLGFLAQSPTGEGCRVRFDEIAFEERRLDDLRSGE